MGRDGDGRSHVDHSDGELRSDDEWDYAVEDVGNESGESDDRLEGVFGMRRAKSEVIERESVDVENALFVMLGVALTLFAVWQAIP